MHLRSQRQYTLQGMENCRESICILLVSQTSPQLTSHIVVTQPWVLDHCQQRMCTSFCNQEEIFVFPKKRTISFNTKIKPSLEYQYSQLVQAKITICVYMWDNWISNIKLLVFVRLLIIIILILVVWCMNNQKSMSMHWYYWHDC